jgi:hypothetical protein
MLYLDVVKNVETDSEVLLMQVVEMQDRGDWIMLSIAFRRKRDVESVYERVGCARTDISDILYAFCGFGEETVTTVVQLRSVTVVVIGIINLFRADTAFAERRGSALAHY